MENVDVVIIGAGVVGLAVAERLSAAGKETVVVERHDGFGRETSSRNSEVIHAGLYYPDNSLKARLCVEGRRMLYEFCERNSVPHRKFGKIVVANTREDGEKIVQLYEQGKRNGVQGLEILDAARVARMEPEVRASSGLYSPETGTVDTHLLMKCLESLTGSNGGMIAYNCEVKGVAAANGGYTVSVLDADGEMTGIAAPAVVNAAGLGADAVCAMAGIDIDAAGYRQYHCKGEYFAVSSRHKAKLNRLVYPAPTSISLGIHAVFGLDGSLRLGPNAFYVDEINYDVDPGHLETFAQGAAEYLPFVLPGDLRPDQSGIRPKLQGPGDTFKDFVIREESARGLPGFVSLVGIESPGLTSCLAIAEMVAGLIS